MTRQCGECQLCCKLIPVAEIGKRAGERCRHQRHGQGCVIYAQRPLSCRGWSCRWLINADTADMPRPDRRHYVIDVMPDYVTVVDDRTGERIMIQCEQIWVDPDYPDAHRDPKLRAYLARRGEEGIVGLVRWNNRDGMVIFPPAMTGGTWHERRDTLDPEEQHSPEAIMEMVRRGELR